MNNSQYNKCTGGGGGKGLAVDGMDIFWNGLDSRGNTVAQGYYMAKISIGNKIFAKSFNIIK